MKPYWSSEVCKEFGFCSTLRAEMRHAIRHAYNKNRKKNKLHMSKAGSTDTYSTHDVLVLLCCCWSVALYTSVYWCLVDSQWYTNSGWKRSSCWSVWALRKVMEVIIWAHRVCFYPAAKTLISFKLTQTKELLNYKLGYSELLFQRGVESL